MKRRMIIRVLVLVASVLTFVYNSVENLQAKYLLNLTDKVIHSAKYDIKIIDETKKTAALVKVHSHGKNVVIPKKVGDYKIVQIGQYWEILYPEEVREKQLIFHGTSNDAKTLNVFDNGVENMKTLKIPEGVKWIGDCAFENTPKLTSIDFPKTLINIGDKNFINAKKLKKLQLKNGLMINESFCGAKLDEVELFGEGTLEEGYYEDCVHAFPQQGKDVEINKLYLKGKKEFYIDYCYGINTIVLSKKLKELMVEFQPTVKKIVVNSKSTKVKLSCTEFKKYNLTINYGSLKKNKKNIYRLSKPKVTYYDDECYDTKINTIYVLKYKNKKGKSITKHTKKNKIKLKNVKSKISVVAMVKCSAKYNQKKAEIEREKNMEGVIPCPVSPPGVQGQ